MKLNHGSRIVVIALLTVVVTGTGCGEWEVVHDSGGPSHHQVAPGDKVIIVVIDGARYTETFGDPTHAHIPRLWNDLRPQGTLVTTFRNQGLTATVPGHTSILSGTWQTIPNDGSQRPTQPTLFEYYRQAYSIPQNETYVVAGKNKLFVCSYSTHIGYGAAYGATERVSDTNDAAVYDSLTAVLQAEHPRLVMVNFPSVDIAGHSGVWDDYVGAIETVDSLVHSLWNELQSDPFYAGQTYLFITNDHGRHDDANGGFRHHGDGCEGCRRIMCLALGPEIRVNHSVPTQSVYTQRDICNTVGDILGFPVPNSNGVSITEIFEPTLTGIAGGD